MFIINHRPFFFWLTGLFLVGAIASLAFFRLPLSIEFTGGSLVEVSYADVRPDVGALKNLIGAAGFSDVVLRESGGGWSDGETANVCIGQGDVFTTPLQMALAQAFIAQHSGAIECESVPGQTVFTIFSS